MLKDADLAFHRYIARFFLSEIIPDFIIIDDSVFVLISAVLPRLFFNWFNNFICVIQKVDAFIISL